MRNLLLALLALVVISCSPSANPALQQKLTTQFNKNSTETYSMSGSFKPMDYQIGQWIELGSKDKDGRMTISRYAIVDRENGGWVIETSSLNDYEETAMQYLVKGMEKASETGDAGFLDIVWIKTKDKDGKVTNLEGPALSMFQGLYKNTLKAMINTFDFTGGTKDNVKVPAGTFNAATKIRSTGTVLGMTVETDAWFHNDVPINGMVKSITTDGKYTSELIDFGKTGAKKSF